MASLARSSSVAVSARAARRAVRSGSRVVVVRAEGGEGEAAPEVAEAAPAPEAAPAEPVMAATVVASVGSEGLIDPADGTIAEGAPLGNDNSLLDAVFAVYKDSRAIETLNGRAAMTGFTMALFAELSSNKDLAHQVLNFRTFNMYDGTVIQSTFPSAGAFLVPLVVLAVLAGSLAPKLKQVEKNGLDVAPDSYGPFTVDAEVLNGRAAMMGLPALLIAEKITGSALF
mmetsp:Transcript_1929/g.6741  ORF Transcript_1929/g.6741 Transcript_1929/m.6741 type:complete len:228 (+) Transcript_1929:76-759(+)|eukprot:CAMPEP_0183793022 /NCGR_PEP_ID=MMETSP0803_2-20130417/2954_1 /TAXON_ID=195967 /ORGANISM="Crustomastix stigmata, Strain CCMP3273" /LENGTH=227 /DNA_ID=CAMNT_0026037395 /DNA_START=51 /DNA_END=734 /DNA_ORIENTATION=+